VAAAAEGSWRAQVRGIACMIVGSKRFASAVSATAAGIGQLHDFSSICTCNLSHRMPVHAEKLTGRVADSIVHGSMLL
jgi:hypothetical protein